MGHRGWLSISDIPGETWGGRFVCHCCKLLVLMYIMIQTSKSVDVWTTVLNLYRGASLTVSIKYEVPISFAIDISTRSSGPQSPP